jgi:hypothetical protein
MATPTVHVNGSEGVYESREPMRMRGVGALRSEAYWW